MHFDTLEGAIEPLASDQVVVLDEPVAIKAGDLIGHLGLYQDGGANQPEKKLHLETFSGDDVEAFIDASRAWAQRLPEKDRTWLKLAKGTPVVPPEGNTTAAQLQMSSASSPLSAADLLVPKKLLDDLPTDRKIQVPASPTRKARTWYRLENLLHDADNNLLDGWVCEEIGVTPWVSPWALGRLRRHHRLQPTQTPAGLISQRRRRLQRRATRALSSHCRKRRQGPDEKPVVRDHRSQPRRQDDGH